MTECLDEEAILSFCRGSMAGAKRPGVEAHIAECDECRALVSAVARSSLVEPKELIADPAMAPTTPAQGGFAAESGRGASMPLASGPSKPPPSAPVRAGEILAGKYAVERVLGAGGMGVVVAARHTQLDQRFALKFLLPTACEAPGAIARFLREGKSAARITSEHVARVVDTGTLDNGSPFLVMEYLEGSDLGALIAERGPLSPADAMLYVLQACEAIVEAHQLGIVHRDLKPANLFLARRKDGSPLVKVLDFGVSKANGGSQPQLTSTSMLMGSPRYMSPEQMVSAKDVDARTDVWALGVILYELVAGRPVWHADTVQGLCALIATAPAPPLRMLVPHAPALLEAVILRCLAKAPHDRLPGVADLALALEPVAPAAARTSIDRILGVAGRSRSMPAHSSGSGGPVPGAFPVPIPIPIPPGTQPMPAWSATGPTAQPSGSGSGKFVLLLAALVGVLVVAGVVLNTVVARPERTPAARIEPTASHSAASSGASAVEPASEPPPVAIPAAPALPASAAAVATAPPSPPGRSTAPRARPPEPPRVASAKAEPAPLPSAHPSADAPNRALSDRK